MNETELKVFKELETYKDPAHESILLMMNLFQSVEEINAQKCYDLGFVNSQNVKYWDSITRREDCNEFVKCYLKVLKIYGPNSVLVTQQEFINIVEKYKLMCGPFYYYTGSIPDSQLDKISCAKSNLIRGHKRKLHPYYLTCITDIRFKLREDFSENFMYDILRFPFYEEDFHKIYVDDCLENRGFNSGPISSVLYHRNKNLFIAAPAEDMGINETVNKELRRLELEELKRKRLEEKLRKDPLICTWIPNIGVIVHTAWGIESSDELLQQRNIVNNFILGIIKKYKLKPLFF